MKEYVIIVAGGKGVRMGGDTPKQFLLLNDKAIILHTLEKFSQALPTAELVLVLPKNEISRWEELSRNTSFENIQIAVGGESRFESVRSGLSLIPAEGVVGVHDAVRPFVSINTIRRIYSAAVKLKTAIPVIELKSSIREIKGENSEAVNRDSFRLVQTPQCFHSVLLKRAYEQQYNSAFTDDATVVEAIGETLNLVDGDQRNIKITTVEDLKMAEVFLDRH